MKWLALLTLFLAFDASATTYYVRTDGGTFAQCDGKTNAAYRVGTPGIGVTSGPVAPHCAWSHPFIALPPGGSPPRIAPGDTLMIGSGSYMMGYGAPETGNCYANAAYNCIMQSPPSGIDPAHKTRILGNCAAPPELWGTQRAYAIVQIRGVQGGSQASNIEVGCLELTDHSSCIENHCTAGGCPGGLDQIDVCKRASYPFGTWAENGLIANDSANVNLHDLNIHGLGSEGIHAGRLTNWLVQRVKIRGNGFAGWDGDVSNGVPTNDSSNHGTLQFQNLEIAWSGCGERYPGGEIFGCWDQNEGGYGDGFGTGHTSGNWVFQNSYIHDNVSDGLDLLYADGTGSVTVTGLHSEGNAGNQLKLRGTARVTNSIIVGTCADPWSTFPPNNYSDPSYDQSQFVGKYNMQLSGNCRASGDAVMLSTIAGETHTLINNTITSQSSCLVVESKTGGASDVGSKLVLANNILSVPAGQINWQRFATGGGTVGVCGYYDYDAHPAVTYTHNIFYGVKGGQCPGDSNCSNPLFLDPDPTHFIPKLLPGSPARNAGDRFYCVMRMACNIGAVQ